MNLCIFFVYVIDFVWSCLKFIRFNDCGLKLFENSEDVVIVFEIVVKKLKDVVIMFEIVFNFEDVVILFEIVKNFKM